MKTFAIQYELTTYNELVIKANKLKEAKNKVKEVLGEEVNIVDGWEITK